MPPIPRILTMLTPAEIFETFRSSSGQILCWEKHWHRFQGAVQHFGSPLPREMEVLDALRGLPPGEWRVRLSFLLSDGIWKLERGPAESRLLTGKPVLLHLRFLPKAAVTGPWKCLPNPVLEPIWREFANRKGEECLLLDAQGRILEGSISSVFWKRKGVLYTPSLSLAILPGVTRARVIEEADSQGIKVEEGEFPAEVLEKAEEIFLTNAVAGVVPAQKKTSPQARFKKER